MSQKVIDKMKKKVSQKPGICKDIKEIFIQENDTLNKILSRYHKKKTKQQKKNVNGKQNTKIL